jgi:hypothetical protein
MILSNLFFTNIILWALGELQGVLYQNDFKILKNQYLNMTLSESSLISSVYKASRMQCIGLCTTDSNCLTAIYDISYGKLNSCFTYNKYFQTSQFIPSGTAVVYEKKSSKIIFFNILFYTSTLTPKKKFRETNLKYHNINNNNKN